MQKSALLAAVLVAAVMIPGIAQTLGHQDQGSAPRFSLRTVQGRRLGSDQLKKDIVILDFWATWCEPCIREIAVFNKLQETYSSRGVRVVGLAVQSGWASDVKRFVAKHKMRYTILVGNDRAVSDFDVIAFPTTYLIAPGWRTYSKYSGAYEGKGAELERDIEMLLKQTTEKEVRRTE